MAKAKLKAKSKAKPKNPTKSKKVGAVKPKTSTVTSASAKGATKKSQRPDIDWSDFFSPLGSRILLEREDALLKTAGGLFIPDFAQESPNHARVLVAGPGSRSKTGRLQPLDVQVGDRVLFSAYAGTPINLQGQDLLLVKEEEIQAILP